MHNFSAYPPDYRIWSEFRMFSDLAAPGSPHITIGTLRNEDGDADDDGTEQ
mgnify:CR=1 FL=1